MLRHIADLYAYTQRLSLLRATARSSRAVAGTQRLGFSWDRPPRRARPAAADRPRISRANNFDRFDGLLHEIDVSQTRLHKCRGRRRDRRAGALLRKLRRADG